MSGLNTGTPIRFLLQAKAQILSQSDDQSEFSLFGPQDLGVDWSLYDFHWGTTLVVAQSDTKVLPAPVGAATIEALVVKTTAPVDLNYTQDNVAKTLRVRPLVKPSNYFSSPASPSQKPEKFSPGVFVLTGGGITAVSVVGVVGTTQSARVVVAWTGYNVAP